MLTRSWDFFVLWKLTQETPLARSNCTNCWSIVLLTIDFYEAELGSSAVGFEPVFFWSQAECSAIKPLEWDIFSLMIYGMVIWWCLKTKTATDRNLADFPFMIIAGPNCGLGTIHVGTPCSQWPTLPSRKDNSENRFYLFFLAMTLLVYSLPSLPSFSPLPPGRCDCDFKWVHIKKMGVFK